jgi:cytochrome c-type biogenesis protein CcmE
MNRRLILTIFGVAAIIGFVAFGAGAFKSSLTPYVTFRQARATTDTVQVAGKLVRGSDHYDEGSSTLRFALQDKTGDTMDVAYTGLKPGNFEDAIQVVAIGRIKGHVLQAEKLLVKCPSKYQGVDDRAYPAKAS